RLPTTGGDSAVAKSDAETATATLELPSGEGSGGSETGAPVARSAHARLSKRSGFAIAPAGGGAGAVGGGAGGRGVAPQGAGWGAAGGSAADGALGCAAARDGERARRDRAGADPRARAGPA